MTVLLLTPRRLEDERGWFAETWHRKRYAAEGVDSDFCQDNHSYSKNRGTLRGLHFQTIPKAQAKLVRCTRGRIFDVAVDIRRASPTYGQWVGAVLSADAGNQLFLPAGYAHGFVTLEDDCEVAYKVDSYYSSTADSGIAWNDPAIGIDWPLGGARPILSDKDLALPQLAEASPDFPYDGNPLRPIGRSVEAE
jgi:dTDP-4-dehydrorhamnose 3,5-epimerase